MYEGHTKISISECFLGFESLSETNKRGVAVFIPPVVESRYTSYAFRGLQINLALMSKIIKKSVVRTTSKDNLDFKVSEPDL